MTTMTTLDELIERLQRALGDDPVNNRAELPESSVTVLVMDDDPIDRRAMVRALGKIEGVGELKEASCIDEARQIIAKGGIEIAFFDFRLPDGESFDLLPMALELCITVVIVTGAGNERIAVRAMSSGASGYLIKDVAGHYLTLLPAKMTQYLHARRLESERDFLLKRVEEALAMVRFMGSFVSMCCMCKKIRVADEKWEPIESYISQRSSTQFSHGYCPDCFHIVRREMEM